MSQQYVPSLEAEVARLQAEIQALHVSEEQITIADYLLKRLEQLGVKVSSSCKLNLVLALIIA